MFSFNFHSRKPGMPYKCLTLGIDVQSNNMKISSISGLHHYNKKDIHVERIELMSAWSTFLPIGFGNFFPNLAEIEIRDTPLRGIRRKNFEAMRKLVLLSIENSKISTISDDTFKDLVNLQELTIRKSFLSSLSPKLFHSLKNLRSFDGKFNKISLLEEGLFSKTSKLESINFSGNLFREIQTNFTSLTNLHEAYFFKCGCVDAYFLKSNPVFTLRNLQKLMVKRCRVEKLENKTETSGIV
jgi:Leucine-rich repeat (LRR) protein